MAVYMCVNSLFHWGKHSKTQMDEFTQHPAYTWVWLYNCTDTIGRLIQAKSDKMPFCESKAGHLECVQTFYLSQSYITLPHICTKFQVLLIDEDQSWKRAHCEATYLLQPVPVSERHTQASQPGLQDQQPKISHSTKPDNTWIYSGGVLHYTCKANLLCTHKQHTVSHTHANTHLTLIKVYWSC